MSFNNQIPNEETESGPSSNHAESVLALLKEDFESYMLYGYLKDGRRVLMGKGKKCVATDAVMQAMNLIQQMLTPPPKEESGGNEQTPEDCPDFGS